MLSANRKFLMIILLKATNKTAYINEQRQKAKDKFECQARRRKRDTIELSSFQKTIIRRFQPNGQISRQNFDETFDTIFYAPIRRRRSQVYSWWLEQDDSVEEYNFTQHTLEWTQVLRRTPLNQDLRFNKSFLLSL